MIHSTSRPRARKRRLLHLLDASVQAFGQYGFQRCQIADVAREAGVALGTIYRYAESKVALFDAAVRAARGRFDRTSTLECLSQITSVSQATRIHSLRETLKRDDHPEVGSLTRTLSSR